MSTASALPLAADVVSFAPTSRELVQWYYTAHTEAPRHWARDVAVLKRFLLEGRSHHDFRRWVARISADPNYNVGIVIGLHRVLYYAGLLEQEEKRRRFRAEECFRFIEGLAVKLAEHWRLK